MNQERSRYHIIDRQPKSEDILTEVLEGLSQCPKRLPPKLFYDAQGSLLFEAITKQPEYYLTRAEQAILDHIQEPLQALVPHPVTLIELGSGSGAKTRQLLRHLPQATTYVAIDISLDALHSALSALSQEFLHRQFIGVAADYGAAFSLPQTIDKNPKLLVYLGSTLGNFDPPEAQDFLERWAQNLSSGDALLIGIDLKKQASILHHAYNDAKGITAAFNRNVLTRINRECGANFPVNHFSHHAEYQAQNGRIAMYLVSHYAHRVSIAGHEFVFEQGERILTEYSYKYTITEFQSLARQAGWIPLTVWTDPRNAFSLHYLRPYPKGTKDGLHENEI
ncbi:L-histidine N(alpha)-methyltransferase [Sulfobacillus thermosulfidooxidans]|uniref:L-histidine N(alpha)-methyltransferase n=1 Tax=Sulfobacillus thermosulfidooxidans TaxID=28034 RepID=UPI000403F3F8|nr:L-histidine N(alpha)-methyltransferase [Sulfobacillus thermosulfidooxidans]